MISTCSRKLEAKRWLGLNRRIPSLRWQSDAPSINGVSDTVSTGRTCQDAQTLSFPAIEQSFLFTAASGTAAYPATGEHAS